MLNALPLLFFLGLPAATAAASTATIKTIVFFGDSLTAGYGLEDPGTMSFPGLVQSRITDEKFPYKVVNAGLSGETTAGGLRRLDWILRQKVDVFVLELGGNDGLRGLSPEKTQENLQAIIDGVRKKYPACKILLAGMQVPPSMGRSYAERFARIYPDLAKKNDVALIPFVLEGVGGIPELNMPDGIHPTAEGHKIVASTLWKHLKPLL